MKSEGYNQVPTRNILLLIPKVFISVKDLTIKELRPLGIIANVNSIILLSWLPTEDERNITAPCPLRC